MKALLSAFILSISLLTEARAFHLKNGDLILQPTACHLCSLIEAEEKSPYSHMGVLIKNGKQWSVLEAWGKVKITSLEDFLSRRKKNTKSLILRSKKEISTQEMTAENLLFRFSNHFEGLDYDPQFLWNNFSVDGEKLYCSEFAAKFIQPYLINTIHTKPMHFEINREQWMKYFRGNPPDGAPGLSPGDFERSPLFNHIGFI